MVKKKNNGQEPIVKNNNTTLCETHNKEIFLGWMKFQAHKYT
jgi:hypothetical protein